MAKTVFQVRPLGVITADISPHHHSRHNCTSCCSTHSGYFLVACIYAYSAGRVAALISGVISRQVFPTALAITHGRLCWLAHTASDCSLISICHLHPRHPCMSRAHMSSKALASRACEWVRILGHAARQRQSSSPPSEQLIYRFCDVALGRRAPAILRPRLACLSSSPSHPLPNTLHVLSSSAKDHLLQSSEIHNIMKS